MLGRGYVAPKNTLHRKMGSEKAPSETVRKGVGVALGPRFLPTQEGQIGFPLLLSSTRRASVGPLWDFSGRFSRQIG